MKKKHIIILKKTLFFLLAICLLLLINIDIRDPEDVQANNLVVEKWNDSLNNVHPITNPLDLPGVSHYVSFKDFYSNLNAYKNLAASSYKVVIEDEYDLQNLSMLMMGMITYNGINFLNLNYVLGKDIQCEIAEVYPMGSATKPFTGSFDGQGFALINVLLNTIDYTTYETYYSPTEEDLLDYALFPNNAGEIKNLRLIDPIAYQEVITEKILYAAPLVGHNSGSIENCSVTSSDSVLVGNIEVGRSFAIENGIIVSTMVSKNSGTISNCFVGTSHLYFTGTDMGTLNNAYPVIYQNTGALTNVYFDSEVFIPAVEDYNTEIIEVPATADFQDTETFALEFLDNWYFNSSYTQVLLNDTYPVLHGLHLYANSHDTYEIKNPVDLITFTKLVQRNATMASRNYILTNCIDMSSLASDAYVAPTSPFTGRLYSEYGTIVNVDSQTKQATVDGCEHNHFIPDITTNYHSIWNFRTVNASKGTKTVYALVNELSGTIENINFINYSCAFNYEQALQGNIVYCGSVAGAVLEGGVINNVNVYGDIALPSGSYGAIYIGGLVGINSGTISNSSFAGKIDGGVHTLTGALINQNGIGGIAGTSQGGTFENLINTARIIGLSFSTDNTTSSTYIGGIIGSGAYASVKNVINEGMIISHNNAQGYLANVYIGGIISKLTNVNAMTENTSNKGDIRLMINNSLNINDYHASGFGTVSTESTTQVELTNIINSATVQIASRYQVAGNNIVFTADFKTTDYNNIRISSGGTTANPSGTTNIGGAIKLTGCIIIDTQTAAKIDGVYQTSPQTIDIGIIYRYAPVIFSLNESTEYLIEVSHAVNEATADVEFITTRPMYNQKVSLYGNTYGDYIFFDYIRNEGDLTVDITFTSVNTFKLSGDDLDYSSNLRIAGLIGTLENYDSTEGYHIYNSYNGGNITITNSYFVNGVKTLLSTKEPDIKTQTLQYMLYIGGIAIRNNSNQHITEADVTNVMISSSRKGTIHNCLNDGDIYVDLNLYGCSRIGGICSINNGLISTCFNTGVIYNYVALYLSPQNVDPGDMGGNDFEVEVGGITCMIGDRKGQIMDCANYGNIYCINPVHNGAGWLNAAGIVGRNEKKQDNTGNPQTNWAGKVQFCVNYGDIYSWNQVSEPFSEFLFTGSGTKYIGAESSCKAAGIIAIGVLNVINCANYGNIYSRYLAGGIFGLVDGTKFTQITSDIYIANSINYGIVRRLTQFNKSAPSYPEQFGEPAPIPAPRSITISSVTYKINSMFGGAIGYIYGTSVWARAGISTSSSGWSESAVSMLTHLQISFLINFDDQANIIGSQTLYKFDNNNSRTPLGDLNTQKYSKMVRYMATTKNEDQSMYPFNSFTYTYSSTTYTVNASYQNIVYSVPEYPLSKDSGGIFADDFPLRGGDLDYSITTNAYIRNYINFVDYDYTNKTLVNKIFTDTNDRIGIYAVASSKGILNGYYLPDNINWGSVSDPGLDPITNGAIDSSWRGDLTSQDNLKWKFEVGMRQVSNEIAATVFDLELTDGQGRIIDAPIIDHQNKIINFYVGDNEGAEGGGNHVVQSYTVSNPTIDTNAKTITYSSSGQVVAKYDYSSGQLVRIDSNLTAVSFGSMAYFSVTQYEAGTITNYYVRRNNNYQQATDSDRLFTVTQGSTYGFYTRSSKTLSSATVYDYTYNSSSSGSRYMISANELTNRNLTTTTVMYRITNTTNYTASYRQQTIPADYELYVAYPTSITVSVNYYENYYTVNTADNSYRLAEGASIDLATAQNISIPIPGVVNGRFTSSIGTNTNNYLYIMPGAETPQGAQPLAPTRYEIRINRIPDKQLSNLQIRRNGTIIAHQNGVITNALQKNTTQVLEITYTSVNIPDKQNLMRYTVFQKWDDDLNHYEDYSSESAMGTTYTLSGGKVVNKTGVFNAVLGEYDSAQLVNGVFPNGQLTFTLEFYNIIPAGQYRLYTEFCSTVYAVEFEILRSNVANIEEMTYVQGFLATSGTWVNTNNVTSLITYLRYDTIITSYLDDDGTLPYYLSDIKISPYAEIISISYQSTTAKAIATTITNIVGPGGPNYSNDSFGCKAYIVTYTMRAEDGTTHYFNHYFVEVLLDTSVQYVYMNGISKGQTTTLSFIRSLQPVVNVFYDYSGIDYANLNQFSITVGYNYDHEKYPKPANGENPLILASVDYVVSPNGISITFNNDVACDYTFTVGYTRKGQGVESLVFEEFHIQKVYNTESMLVRVLFNTDNPFSSVGTIIYNGHAIEGYTDETTVTVNEVLMTRDIYDILSANSNLRMIKAMPNRIYYNDQAPRYLTDPQTSAVYNRYDVVGFVSKTDLTDFTPTFTLPVGAVIYQLDSGNNPVTDSYGNPVLNASFVDDSGGTEFNYIHYRIYSEASPTENGFCIPNSNNDNYTDYYVAVVDVSYNVYFRLSFDFASEQIRNQLLTDNSRIMVNFYRHEVGEDEEEWAEEISITSSIFYYFVDTGDSYVTSYGHNLGATASGAFQLCIDLPEGYTYDFTISRDENTYEDDDYFTVPASIYAYRYDVTITIGSSDTMPTWGQQGKTQIGDTYN